MGVSVPLLASHPEKALTVRRFEMSEIPGKRIDLNEYDGLSGRSPVPFEIEVKPRHGNVERLLNEA